MKRPGSGRSRKKRLASASVLSSVVPQVDIRECIEIKGSDGTEKTAADQSGKRLPTLQELEREYIRRVLSHVNDNRTKAAEILGIDRVSLWRKIKRHAAGAVSVLRADR